MAARTRKTKSRLSARTRTLASRLGVRIRVRRAGKYVYKSAKQVNKNIRNAVKRRACKKRGMRMGGLTQLAVDQAPGPYATNPFVYRPSQILMGDNGYPIQIVDALANRGGNGMQQACGPSFGMSRRRKAYRSYY